MSLDTAIRNLERLHAQIRQRKGAHSCTCTVTSMGVDWTAKITFNAIREDDAWEFDVKTIELDIYAGTVPIDLPMGLYIDYCQLSNGNACNVDDAMLAAMQEPVAL